MRLLLDTSIVIWALADHPLLKSEAREKISKSEICFVSSITIAEIEIKKSIGKLEIQDGYVEMIQDSGFEPLSFGFKEARILGNLPFYHKDPFDRMLITQALLNDLTLMTSDRVIIQYDIPVILN